ncbi:hypothetical protein ACE193_12000 [Bernardetia sp. OM2101]|uniref:hypothetical protein n=1 Tax=Bernardetia sp. OM2101 TaxID=3344876 RepID=UPI0035D030E2
MRFEIIVYFLGILIGTTITYFGLSYYFENCEIREQGVEVEVTMIKETRYTKNGSIPQVKYKGKIHDWYGKKEKAGKTYTAIYSPSNDALFDPKSTWYKPILMGGFFIVISIYGIIKELFFSKS